ncbi:Vps5 C terminal like-domain-containing protein [Vararia minispora EC-137]|uniref:Vps5 C terminal like-domain-containing protein n=1 Tax=Vararia minispora EC-137 TaxID=1314806 RepID=A0ACB8QKE8_9AGAM|nr:Vps5 C terminal like-domain-containing protein [Vararia minispora EC-137]
MADFDDLLEQSQSALEDSPFANPFAQPRSSSPDPWSSYGTESSSSTFDYGTHNVFADDPSAPSSAAFDGSASTAASFEDEANVTPVPQTRQLEPEIGLEPELMPSEPLDPLDSTAANASEEPPSHSHGGALRRQPSAALPERTDTEPPLSSTSSSSRESASRPTSPRSPSPRESPPTRPISPPSAAPTPPPMHTETNAEEPSSARLPQRQSYVASKPLSPEQSRIITPLDQLATNNFPSLVLGGEAGGWGDSPNAYYRSELDSPAPVTTQAPTEEDEDDDKPLRPRPTDSSEKKPVAPMFIITVDDPQKVGDPIRGYTMYTVHTKTTSTIYAKPSFSVLRRYSDFLWLYETLSLNNPGVVVPPVPEKNTFGRFDDQFVQQRRMALENCITKIANHPVLCKDQDLKLFLESDTFSLDIKHRKAEIAHERGGLMSSIGHTLTGPRFVENDEWFDRQKSHLDTLEAQLRGFIKAIELASRNRSEVAISIGEFVQIISDLASSDIGQSLSHSLSALADLERKAQELESAQAQADLVTIMSTADEYARLINSVRLAFNSRIRMYYAWQNSEADARRVHQNHERNRAQGKILQDRLPHALNLVADAERRALDAKQEFEACSRLVKVEVARFERERVEDFKRSLEQFLDGMIVRQKEIIAAREDFQQLILKKVQSTAPPPQVHANGAMMTPSEA